MKKKKERWLIGFKLLSRVQLTSLSGSRKITEDTSSEKKHMIVLIADEAHASAGKHACFHQTGDAFGNTHYFRRGVTCPWAEVSRSCANKYIREWKVWRPGSTQYFILDKINMWYHEKGYLDRIYFDRD